MGLLILTILHGTVFPLKQLSTLNLSKSTQKFEFNGNLDY